MRATRLLGDARVVYVGIGTTAEQFARFLPARPGPDRGDGLVADRQPARHPTGRGRRPRWLGPSRRADLRRPGRRRDPRPIPVRPGRRSGAAGLSARWGITELDDAEAEIQRSAIERSDRVVVIADGSKIGGGARTRSSPTPNGSGPWSPTQAASEPELDALAGARRRDRHRRRRRRGRRTRRADGAATRSGGEEGAMDALERIFGTTKPVIAMLHFPGLPGRPHHDVGRRTGPASSTSSGATSRVLQEAGVDGLLFCNEADHPVPARGRTGDPGRDGRDDRRAPRPRSASRSA